MTQIDTSPNEKEIPPKIGQETISQVLNLLDSEYKKVTYDGYSSQMANTRNYLWLFFILISFCIAFFKEASLGISLLNLIEGNPVSAFFLPTMIGFSCVLSMAIIGFWLGISIISQNNVALPYENLSEMLTELECERFDELKTYQFRRKLLDNLQFSLTQAIRSLEHRGRSLRKLSFLFKFSVTGILITLIFYGGMHIR